MSVTGPAPKDPSIRQRRNKDAAPMRVLEAAPVDRPELPEFEVTVKVEDVQVDVPFVWPDMTRAWWESLDRHPLASEFIDADWAFLLETALIHAAFWRGDLKLAAELRQRESKYGFTPEDRLKMRISLAAAVEGEQRVMRRAVTQQAPKGTDPRLKLVE